MGYFTPFITGFWVHPKEGRNIWPAKIVFFSTLWFKKRWGLETFWCECHDIFEEKNLHDFGRWCCSYLKNNGWKNVFSNHLCSFQKCSLQSNFRALQNARKRFEGSVGIQTSDGWLTFSHENLRVPQCHLFGNKSLLRKLLIIVP